MKKKVIAVVLGLTVLSLGAISVSAASFRQGIDFGGGRSAGRGPIMQGTEGERPAFAEGEVPEKPEGDLQPEIPEGEEDALAGTERPELPDFANGEHPEFAEGRMPNNGQQPPAKPEGDLKPEIPEGEEDALAGTERPELPDFANGERPEFAEGEMPELPDFANGERPELPMMNGRPMKGRPTGQAPAMNGERPALPTATDTESTAS